MDIIKIFGKNVKYYRMKSGLSQEDLADECGLHRTYISEIERFKRNVSLENVQRIAEAFNIDAYELLNPQIQLKQLRSERIPGTVQPFYVFQGSTFNMEYAGGYIWAPKYNSAGQSMHHWDKLLDVCEGDIIIHGADARIKAISIAKGSCYDSTKPGDFNPDIWENNGRKIDCQYYKLSAPIKTSDFIHDILKYCNVKYAPFGSNGNGNMGYLYDINRDLAKIFIRACIEKNNQLLEIDALTDFLNEDE